MYRLYNTITKKIKVALTSGVSRPHNYYTIEKIIINNNKWKKNVQTN